MVKSVFHLNMYLFQFCFIQIPSWQLFFSEFWRHYSTTFGVHCCCWEAFWSICLAFTDNLFPPLIALRLLAFDCFKIDCFDCFFPLWLVSHSYTTLGLGLDFIYICLGYTVLPELMNSCFSNKCGKFCYLFKYCHSSILSILFCWYF